MSDLLDSLEQSVQSRRKKNVEVLWTAAMVSKVMIKQSKKKKTLTLGLTLKQLNHLAAKEGFFSQAKVKAKHTDRHMHAKQYAIQNF